MQRVLIAGSAQLLGLASATWGAWRLWRWPGVALVAGGLAYRTAEQQVSDVRQARPIIMPMADLEPAPDGRART